MALSDSPSCVCIPHCTAVTLTAVTLVIFPPRSTKFCSSTRVSLGCRDHRVSSSGTQKGSSIGFVALDVGIYDATSDRARAQGPRKCAKCSRVYAGGTWNPGHKVEYAAANGWQSLSQRVYFEHQYLHAIVEYQAGWRRGSYISPHCEKCEEMREV